MYQTMFKEMSSGDISKYVMQRLKTCHLLLPMYCTRTKKPRQVTRVFDIAILQFSSFLSIYHNVLNTNPIMIPFIFFLTEYLTVLYLPTKLQNNEAMFAKEFDYILKLFIRFPHLL